MKITPQELREAALSVRTNIEQQLADQPTANLVELRGALNRLLDGSYFVDQLAAQLGKGKPDA